MLSFYVTSAYSAPRAQRDKIRMHWLVYHIASGHAFFTGVTLVIIAALLSIQSNATSNRIAVLSFVIGAIAITISSTAIPYWYYVIAVVVTAAWGLSRRMKKWQAWTPYAVVAAWLGAVGLEVPYHLSPTLEPAPLRAITVIGDSVTAGTGDNDPAERWPTILARKHGVTVQDISHMGETAASALKRVKQHLIAASVVVLEIGGNDLLGSTSSAQFARDLDDLLTQVSSPGRQLLMLELPLPPFSHEYGRIQRSLARKHDVFLAPKSMFLSILAPEDSTLDTIHL